MFFILYSSVKITLGIKNSIMIDTDLGIYYHLPKELGTIILNHDRKVNMSNYSKNEISVFEELANNNIGFFTTKPDLFPKYLENKNIQFEYNSILNIKKEVDINTIERIFNQLESIRCWGLEIRILDQIYLKKTIKILTRYKNSSFGYFSFYINCNDYVDFDYIENLLNQFKQIGFIMLYALNEIDYQECSKKLKNRSIVLSRKMIDFKDIRNFTLDSFIINRDFFRISNIVNNFHFGRFYFDNSGFIYVCEIDKNHFGHISDTNLEDVIKNPEFTKYWHIKKDDITKCKDCEFRYICTDCRAYRDDPDDLYSAPLKCGYDPYNGVWEEWSINPLKQKAIAFYGMEDLVKQTTENQ